ncbi:60S ribosomal protein L7-like [Culex quinquefasciatus]|uniref:60S ribosomal protein L7-like n=1 Tax=Culex quinquefasciatus TaxID=7176 RepID=UPI0018E308B3|nr:60S ribosomal protein L7-like [Culex quinquefasciatus]
MEKACEAKKVENIYIPTGTKVVFVMRVRRSIGRFLYQVLLLFHLNQISNPNLYKDTNNMLRIADSHITHGYPLLK